MDVGDSARSHYAALRAALFPDLRKPSGVTMTSALRTLPDWCAMASDSGYGELVYEIKKTFASGRALRGSSLGTTHR
ncbi:hypothetical protein ACWGII_26160 [Streptomyces sp. NPDC054855]